MKNVTVVATFEARPGRAEELKEVLLALVAPTRQETGCLNYDLHVSPDNPARFLFHENWASRTLLDEHLQSPHFKAAFPRMSELCAAAPEIKFWEKLL